MGLSMRELARRTGLSASFLSQMESGKTNASLDTLRRISEVIEMPIFRLLADDSHVVSPVNQSRQPCDEDDQFVGVYTPVVRGGCRTKMIIPPSRVTYELLVPDLGRKMEAFCGRLSPNTGNVARRLREPTEEFILVLSGVLQIGLRDQEYKLYAGDSIYFEGYDLYSLACGSKDQDVVWISVITPPVF
jgi:DNA-binding XRE family transcriptional regulator/mannose-6-phosphate isomerase-like protein (cupin superfamily)